jgi:ABC-type Fe3+-hydroxamate transport system substrate-binding protein
MMKPRQFPILLAGISSAVLLAACGSTGSSSPTTNNATDSAASMSTPSTGAVIPSDRTAQSETGAGSGATAPTTPKRAVTVTIGETQFLATLADTDTARALSDRLPLTLDMADVNNNEKAFSLADDLPSNGSCQGG